LERINEKILVTGATGMLGSCLVADLIREGCTVRAIYRDKNRIDQFYQNITFWGMSPDLISGSIEWVEADLLNIYRLEEALEGIDTVYHCAAVVSFQPSEWSGVLKSNIEGTANLVNASLEKGVKKICHVSSIAALGKTENGELINEETHWIPDKKHSKYSISKLHSEMEVWRGVNEGVDAVIVNPSVILGPGDWSAGSPSFFRMIDKGLKFYTRGITGFVDVRDVSRAMRLLTDDANWGKAKNNHWLLNSTNLRYESLFKMIAASIGAASPKYLASKGLMTFVGQFSEWYGKIFHVEAPITKETVRNATTISKYDGSKITAKFGFAYHDIESTIQEIGKMYLDSVKSASVHR